MKTNWLIILAIAFSLSACIEEKIPYHNTYRDSFEALWKIVDTRYCYLDIKKINWDSVYTVYNNRLKVDTLSELKFFDAMGEMLAELKDGHVNLYSAFDRSRYGKFFTDYPANFSTSLILGSRYLGDHYRSVNGLRYQKIAGDSIGYLYYSSFSDEFNNQNMKYVFEYFKDCKGLILDVRNNGGGYGELSNQLAGYFFDRDTTSIYIQHKTGPGHSDFSAPVALITKANKDLCWKKPVVVLSNRSSYSATNMFICRMKDSPYATVMGDVSGGGGGIPMSDELPNGWMVRFSASPMSDKDMKTIEFGIRPDVAVALDSVDASKGIDTIIERAVMLITQE